MQKFFLSCGIEKHQQGRKLYSSLAAYAFSLKKRNVRNKSENPILRYIVRVVKEHSWHFLSLPYLLRPYE